MAIRKTLLWVTAGIAALAAALLILVLVVFNSNVASDLFRQQITRQALKRYGARVTVGALSPHLFPPSVDLNNVTISSDNASPRVPILDSTHILIGVRLLPLLHGKLQLSRLVLDEPVVRLRIDAQGRSNFSIGSGPRTNSTSGSNTSGALFDLAVGDCSIRAGQLYYNDARVPLDAAFHNLRLSAAYSLLSDEYKGSLAYDRGIWNESGLEPISHSLQVDFTASHSTFSFSSLRLATTTSAIALTGKLSNYADPVIDASYQASVGTRELGAILHESSLPAGQVNLDGTVAYHSQPSHSFLSDLNLQGRMSTNELLVSDLQSVRLVGISANYELKEANLKVRNIAAGLLGGSLRASADFDKIDSAAPVVRLDGSLEKLSLARVSDAFAPPSVQRIPLEGKANLKAQASWTGSFANWTKTMVASSQLSISAPNQAANSTAILVDGAVMAEYNGRQQVLSVRQSYLQTKHSRISMSGSLAPGGHQSAMMAISATTGDIREVVSLVSIIRSAMQPSEPQTQVPDIGGSATFAGSATGSLDTPRLQGTLTGETLSVNGTRVRSVRTNLVASPSEVRLQDGFLTGDSREQVSFSGQVGLQDWSVQPGSPISVQAKASGITVAELASLARFKEPLTGAVTANIAISGTRASPEGAAVITVANGSAWNEPFTKLLLDGNFHDGGLRSAISLQIPAGNLSANVSYVLATQAYTLDLQAANLQLGRFTNLSGKNIQGAANISAKGAGTITNPSLEANFAIPELKAQGQTVSKIAANVNVAGRRANVALRSTVDQGSVEGTGDVTLGGDYFTEAKLDITALPLAAVAANFLPAQSSKLAGQTEVHLTLRGPLSDPAAMEGHLQIPSLTVMLGAGQIGLAAPLEANYRDGVVTIADSTIQGTGMNLTFGASIPIRNSKAYSLNADGTFDLSVLHQFVPDVQSKGEIAVHIASQGTTGQPSMRGQLEVQNAAFSSETFPASVEGLSGAIALSGNRAVLTNVSGMVGGGKIAANGSIELGSESRFTLALNANSVRIRYPQGLRSVLSAQLNAQGTTHASSLTGRVTVDSLSFTQSFDVSTLMGSFSEESGGAPASAFQDGVKLNVALQSAQNLNLASSRLSIGGAANVNIVGTMARPVLLGRVSLNSGEIFYLSKRFELQNGTIEFANPVRTDPILNLFIDTNVEQYKVTLKLAGPVDRLRTSYTSEPSMSQADIIHLLAFGNTAAEAASAAPATATQNAEAVLAQGVSSPLTGKLQSLTGISQLSIDPLATNAYGDPGAEIAIQQRVTGSLLFTFSTNVTTTQNQAASLRYDINKGLSVTILRDQNGGYGVDVRVHKAF